MFEQTLGGQSKKIGIDVIREAQRLRGQELNGDYPGPVFMNQHGAQAPASPHRVQPAVAAKPHRLKQRLRPSVAEKTSDSDEFPTFFSRLAESLT